jgi:hypothetical protein
MKLVFKTVPFAPQHSGEQVAQFGYAESHLRVGSFFSTSSQQLTLPTR